MIPKMPSILHDSLQPSQNYRDPKAIPQKVIAALWLNLLYLLLKRLTCFQIILHVNLWLSLCLWESRVLIGFLGQRSASGVIEAPVEACKQPREVTSRMPSCGAWDSNSRRRVKRSFSRVARCGAAKGSSAFNVAHEHSNQGTNHFQICCLPAFTCCTFRLFEGVSNLASSASLTEAA